MHQKENVLRKVGVENASLISHSTIKIQQEKFYPADRDVMVRTFLRLHRKSMNTTSIRDETYRLLEYGVPQSSVNLVPSPVLESSAPRHERYLAQIHLEFNKNIEEALLLHGRVVKALKQRRPASLQQYVRVQKLWSFRPIYFDGLRLEIHQSFDRYEWAILRTKTYFLARRNPLFAKLRYDYP